MLNFLPKIIALVRSLSFFTSVSGAQDKHVEHVSSFVSAIDSLLFSIAARESDRISWNALKTEDEVEQELMRQGQSFANLGAEVAESNALLDSHFEGFDSERGFDSSFPEVLYRHLVNLDRFKSQTEVVLYLIETYRKTETYVPIWSQYKRLAMRAELLLNEARILREIYGLSERYHKSDENKKMILEKIMAVDQEHYANDAKLAEIAQLDLRPPWIK